MYESNFKIVCTFYYIGSMGEGQGEKGDTQGLENTSCRECRFVL